MTYGIVAIVKDEAENLPNMRRWIEKVPDAIRWTICDTGSTDGTFEGLVFMGAVPYQDEWANFGHNRTLAFQRARGTADWLLALDADMSFEIDEDFEPDPAVDCYMIDFGWSGFRNRLPLLLRGDLPWESRGAVHEYTTLPDRPYVSAPTDKVRIRSNGSHPGTPEKFRWHAQMLEAELEADPMNSRAVFYLANTYRDLGDPRAVEMYDQRAIMGGWAEEVFYSRYEAARLRRDLKGLLAAWESRPTRLEPLHEAVRALNSDGLHMAAYALLQGVSVDPRPSDLLFVHTSVWCWGIDFERSIAEWWVGNREDAYRQMEDLLTRDLPPYIRTATEANLALRS